MNDKDELIKIARIKRMITAAVAIGVIAVLGVIIAALTKKGPYSSESFPEPVKPLTASELPKVMIKERMNDFDYTNGLAILQSRQNELASLRADARAEYDVWLKGFVASNETARGLAKMLEQASLNEANYTNGSIAVIKEKIEALILQDSHGRYLVDKRKKLDAAQEAHQVEIRGFIGSKVLSQAKAHAEDEREMLTDDAKRRIEEGRKEEAARLAEARKKVLREKNWWTNSPSYKVAMQTNGLQSVSVATTNSPAGAEDADK